MKNIWNTPYKRNGINGIHFLLAITILLGSFVPLTSYAYNDLSNCEITVESPYAAHFKTEKGEAFFWSGQSGEIRAQDVALALARETHGTTLEMLLDLKEVKEKVNIPPWDQKNSEVQCQWIKLSAAYAKQAFGKVRAVVGKTRRIGSVWDTVELPALTQNPAVTEIIFIDPATRRPTRILKAINPDA